MAGNPFDDLIPRPGAVQKASSDASLPGTTVVDETAALVPDAPDPRAPKPPTARLSLPGTLVFGADPVRNAPGATSGAAPQAPGGWTDPQQYAEVAKGVIPGVVQSAGTVLQAPDVIAARGQQGAGAFGAAQLALMDRIDRGEAASEMEDAFGYQHMTTDQRQAARAELARAQQAFNPTPVQDRSLFQAGEGLQKFGRGLIPPTPGYEESFGRQVGEGLGSVAFGLPVSMVAGPFAGAAIYGSMGVGEATQRAVEFDRKERAAGRPGLTQDQITAAGLLGVGPGATDVLPVEVLLGRLPVRLPEALKRPIAQGIARIGIQAAIEGVQEGGQGFLQDLIAREVYNSGQVLGENFANEAAVGAGVGGLVETLKQLGSGVVRSAAGRRGVAPHQQQRPAEATERPAGGREPELAMPAYPGTETPPAATPTPQNAFEDLVPASGAAPSAEPVAEPAEPPFPEPRQQGVPVTEADERTTQPAPQQYYRDPETGTQLQSGDVDSILDMWRYVREMQRQPEPERLSSFMRRMGGLRDEGMDVRHLIGGARSLPGIINKAGVHLDAAAHMAWDAGFLHGAERPDINALLSALSDDINGNPVIRIQDVERADDIRVAREMERELYELGLEKAQSEDAVRAHFRDLARQGDAGKRGRAPNTRRAEGDFLAAVQYAPPTIEREARELLRDARRHEAEMRERGATPAQIAAEFSRFYGAPVSAQDVEAGRTWWARMPGERETELGADRSNVSPDISTDLLEAIQASQPFSEGVAAPIDLAARPAAPQVARGIEGGSSAGPRLTQEQRDAALALAQQGLNARQIAQELRQQFGQYVRMDQVEAAISAARDELAAQTRQDRANERRRAAQQTLEYRARRSEIMREVMARPEMQEWLQERGRALAQSKGQTIWTPAMVERLGSPQMRTATAQQVADALKSEFGETAQKLTANAVRQKRADLGYAYAGEQFFAASPFTPEMEARLASPAYRAMNADRAAAALKTEFGAAADRITPTSIRNKRAGNPAIAATSNNKTSTFNWSPEADARLIALQSEAANPTERAEIMNREFGGDGVPALSPKAVQRRWDKIKAATLKAQGDEPMFAAGGWDPDAWLEWIKGNLDAGREDAEGSRGAGDEAGGSASGRQPAPAGAGQAGGNAPAGGGADGVRQSFRVGDLLGRVVDAPPNSLGLRQRYLFLHPPKITWPFVKNAATTLKNLDSGVPNWAAKAHVSEIEPDVWQVMSVKVRKNLAERGLAGDFLDAAQAELGDIRPPDQMPADAYRAWRAWEMQGSRWAQTSVDGYIEHKGTYYAPEFLETLRDSARDLAFNAPTAENRNFARREFNVLSDLLERARPNETLAESNRRTAPIAMAEQALRKHLGLRGKDMDLNSESFFRLANEFAGGSDKVGQELFRKWVEERTKAVERSLLAEGDEAPTKAEPKSKPRLAFSRDVIQPLIDGYRKGGEEGMRKAYQAMPLDQRETVWAFIDALDAKPDDGILAAIQAWHGSPHDFEQFSSSRIGTGEGAQAFGHGLYFAENEGVAKDYRNKLAGKPYIESADAASTYKNDMLNWLKTKDGQPPTMPELKQPGRMYEVNIKANPEDFLDWDKPFEQQPPKVQRALSRFGVTDSAALEKAEADYKIAYDDYMGRPENASAAETARLERIASDAYSRVQQARQFSGLTGRSIYLNLARGRSMKDASDALLDAGIPGVRYLDQVSRGDGEGTRNIVIFDDKLVEIVAKDGKPVSQQERNDFLAAHGSPDLDMSPEARKARAEAMGFDTSTVYYHATRSNKPIDEFRIGMPGWNSTGLFGPETTRSAIFVTANKDLAERIADQGPEGTMSAIVPVYLRRGKVANATNGFMFNQGATLTPEFFERNGLSWKFYNQLAPYEVWRAFDDAEGGRDLRQALLREGYDAVTLFEDYDDVPGVTESVAVLNPANIRSINAAFDPAQDASANLMAAVNAAPKRNPAATAMMMLKMGRPFVLPSSTVDGVIEALSPYQSMVPDGVSVGVLSRVEPMKGKGKADALLTFQQPDGSLFEVPAVAADILGNRAIFVPSLNAIGFIRYDLAGDLGRTLRAELGHEVTHVLRRHDLISAADWARLLAHANSLSLLDSDYRTYLQRIGNQHYSTVPAGVTGRDLYERLYAQYAPDVRAERMDQEAVAHMVELYAHNELLKQEAEPVKTILDAILDGRAWRGGQEAEPADVDLETMAAAQGEDEGADWEESYWEDLARRGTVFEAANAQRNAPVKPSRPVAKSALEASASDLEQKVGAFERDLRKSGASAEEIARQIEAKFGFPVDPGRLAQGDVWWRVPGLDRTIWTPKALGAMKGYWSDQALTIPDIAARMSLELGRDVTPSAIGNVARINRSMFPDRRDFGHGQFEKFWTEPRLLELERIWDSGMTNAQMAEHMSKATGREITTPAINLVVSRERERFPDRRNFWTDDRKDVLANELIQALSAKSAARVLSEKFGRDITPIGIDKMRKKLGLTLSRGERVKLRNRIGETLGEPLAAAHESAAQYPLAPRSDWYGEANYRQTGGVMRMMSPDEFLRNARPMKVDEAARENIDDLKSHIGRGGVLDPLQLYPGGKEDGRHRAIAARELGISQVPVIVFDQTKQSLGRPYDGDQDLLAAAQKGKTRLAALHNLTAENLAFADRMGGIAVPSIAVVKEGMGIKDGAFGNITLIGRKDLGDPEKNPTFDADAWTSRFPRPEYKAVPSKKAQPFIDRMRPYEIEYRDSGVEQAWDYMVNRPDPERAVSALLRDRAMQGMFLREVKGINVPPVMVPALSRGDFPWTNTKAFRQFLATAPSDWYHSEPKDPDGVKAAIQEAIPAAIDEFVSSGQMQKPGSPKLDAEDVAYFRDLYRDRVIGADGKVDVDLYRVWNGGARLLDQETVEPGATREALDKAMEPYTSEFKNWVDDQIVPLYGEPRLKVGGKLAPYSLDNIVRVMTKGPVAAQEEHMTFGEGKARASVAKQFGDLESMRNYSEWQMGAPAEVQAAREKAKALLEEWRTAVVPHNKYVRANAGQRDAVGSTWEALDGSMRALARWAKGRHDASGLRAALAREDFTTVPQDVLDLGVEAGKAFLEAPVPYFEAKPQRAVALNEFAGAVIPKNASQDVKDILDKHGIPYTTYRPDGTGTEQSRAAAKFAQKLAKQGEDTLFATLQAQVLDDGQPMFALGGLNSPGADISAYTRAVIMSKNGATPDEIWNATGWYKDKNGQWLTYTHDQSDVQTVAGAKVHQAMKGMSEAERRSVPTSSLVRKSGGRVDLPQTDMSDLDRAIALVRSARH